MPDIVSPIDESVAFRYEQLDVAAAMAAVEHAATVQRTWRGVPLSERIALCRRVLDTYAARLEENAQQITRMMGKPIVQSRIEFESGTRERVEYLCDVAEEALADQRVGERAGTRRFIRREPFGVVLDIAAWNYPLLIAINVIVPAVLSGNAVLVKHAHQTALVAEQLERAFVQAGAPTGLVRALPVSHETAASVIRSGKLGYVSFTGSVRGGREVYRTVAADDFIGVGLELGGKDPALVLPDADFDYTVENVVDGCFYNAGQSCCAIERIYVHEQLYDRFVEAFAAKVGEYVIGNPLEESTTLGPLVDAKGASHVRDHVARALDAGARRVNDPTSFDVPELSRCYVAPEVLVDVTHDMGLMREETFGPAIGIMKVRDQREAIELMNDSPYGLTASVWTTDERRAVSIGESLQAGTVFMNRSDYLDPALPWSGVKDSGVGCSLSKLGFLQVTRPKSFNLQIDTQS